MQSSSLSQQRTSVQQPWPTSQGPQQQQQLQQQQQQQLQLQQQWRADRRVGVISIAMWLGTAVRVFSSLTLWENTQSAVAMLTMLAIVIMWPTYATDSYLKWRVPALSFLRVFLVALPFNFSTVVFNAIAPNVDTGGRFAVVGLSFQAFLAVRIALLTFTSLGWRVPFRLHLLLQSINVGLLATFGLHPYCDSKLLSSPELQGAAAALHKAMGLFASVFLPNVVVSTPQGPYAQRVAFLLFCWAILGWLLPTLLLLPNATQQQEAAAAAAGRGRARFWAWQLIQLPFSKLLLGLERGLSVLRPPWLQQAPPPLAARRVGHTQWDEGDQEGDQDQDVDEFLPGAASFLLAWCVVLLSAWLGACLIAGPLTPVLHCHVAHHAATAASAVAEATPTVVVA